MRVTLFTVSVRIFVTLYILHVIYIAVVGTRVALYTASVKMYQL